MKLKLSRNTLAFGATSFLVEVSSEMIGPIMPLFLINVLKANAFVVGLIEGISEFIVAVMGLLSGYASDRFGHRKRISVLGYSISASMKALFTIAFSWHQVLGIAALERFGKGIRGVPRDSMMTYSERREHLGKAFGYRKMMDSLGAVAGPLISIILVAWLLPQMGEEGAYRVIFVLAVFPALIGVLILIKYVRDRQQEPRVGKEIVDGLMRNRDYRSMVMAGAVFALAQFSTAFFILKTQEITSSIIMTLFGYTVYNLSYAIFAMPVGALTDKLGGKKMMVFAYLLFALCLFGFAFASDYIFLAFFAVLGIVSAVMETTPRAFIARITDGRDYGTAIGFYQGVTGVLVLPANLLAGALWEVKIAGVHASFALSIVVACAAACLMLYFVRSKRF